MKRLVVTTVLIGCLLSAAVLKADQDGKPEPNAALLYWQAVALLPQFSDAQKHLLHKTPHDKYVTLELGETAKELISSTGMSMSVLRRGSRVRQCNWGLTLEDGPATLLPHVGKMRTLVRLATLHARGELDYEGPRDAKKDMAAVENLVAAVQLGRHIGEDDLLITYLVQNALEQTAVELIAYNVYRLHPDAQTLLLSRLASITRASTLSDALIGEKQVFVGTMKRKFSGKNGEKEFQNTLREYVGNSEVEKLQKQIPNAAAVLRLFDELGGMHDQLAGFCKLPPVEFKPKWEAIEKHAKEKNVIAALFLPSVGRAHELAAVADSRRAMLKAAVRMALGEVEAAKQIKDQYGQTFDIQETEKELIITAKLVVEKKNFSTTFPK